MLADARPTARTEARALNARLLALVAAWTLLACACAALLLLGQPLLAAALAVAVPGALLLLRRPELGFYTVVAGALLFDHHKLPALNLPSGRVPFWDPVGGVPPAAALMIATLGVVVLRRLHEDRRPLLRLGPFFLPCLIFFGVIIYGVGRGITFHDLAIVVPFQARMALIEFGSLVYLPFMYLLAVNLIEARTDLRRLVWVIVGALGLKALQSLWVVARLRAGVFDLNEITPHEDALFLNALALLAAGLWLYRGPRGLRLAGALLLPAILITLVANQRRTGFITLAVGVIVCALMLLSDPRQRRRVLLLGAAGAILATGYTAAFWNSENVLGKPVYAFRSVIAPARARDAESNSWRSMEKVNIERTIERAPLGGIGFGRQYRFWIEEPTLDTTGFTYWRYVSHNVIYWVWMKLGAFGFAVFWFVIGSAIVQAALVFRQARDGEARAFALMVAGFVAMQVVFSYADLGLASGRNMTFLGALLGGLALLLAEQRSGERPGKRAEGRTEERAGAQMEEGAAA